MSRDKVEQLTETIVDIIKSNQNGKISAVGDFRRIEALGDDVAIKVKDFIKVLPEDSRTKLNNGTKINQQGTTDLATSIARCIMSVDDIYNERAHARAVENFTKLDSSKYKEASADKINVISDRNLCASRSDFGSLMEANKKALNANANFTIATTLSVASTQFPEAFEVDKGKESLVMGLAAGMLAKVAGQTTPFKKELVATHGVLPAKVVALVFEAAKQLADTPQYRRLDQKEAMAVGKAIGKQVKDHLFQNKDKDSGGLVEYIIRSADAAATRLVKKFDKVVPKDLMNKIKHALASRGVATGVSSTSPAKSKDLGV